MKASRVVQALSQQAATGRPMGRHTIGPASSGLGRQGCPSRSGDSCGGPGAVPVDSRQVFNVSSHTLVRLAYGLSGHCIKKQCGLVVFQGTRGSRTSPFPSPYRSCSDGTSLDTNCRGDHTILIIQPTRFQTDN